MIFFTHNFYFHTFCHLTDDLESVHTDSFHYEVSSYICAFKKCDVCREECKNTLLIGHIFATCQHVLNMTHKNNCTGWCC